MLRGKLALVTGGAKRIGRSIALELAHAGYDVAFTYRSSVAEAEDTLRLLQAAGVRASMFVCNLQRPEEIAETVHLIAEEYGRIDLLVNSAGQFESVALEAITPERWDAMFAVNTRAPFLVAQACHPHLKRVCGRIVNVGSLGGSVPWANHGHYCASKAALHMLTEVMAKAWAPEIGVNCVAPGMIDQGEAQLERFAARTPLQRNGAAEDIAAAVLWFAAGASFVTGQVLTVDGGLGL